MKKYFLLCALVVVAIVAAFVSRAVMPIGTGAPVSGGVPIRFTELASGAHSNISRRANFLITSPAELSQLWKIVDTNTEKPNIDFTKNIVVAVFMGDKPTFGYSIEVSGVADSEKRTVTALLKVPGGSCVVGRAVTNPYQIISIPTTSLAFTHKDEIATVSCLE